MKVVVATFNQEKALVQALSVITNLRMDLFEALVLTVDGADCCVNTPSWRLKLLIAKLQHFKTALDTTSVAIPTFWHKYCDEYTTFGEGAY